VLPRDTARGFVALATDAPTKRYLSVIRACRRGVLKTTPHRVFCRWMSDFDADGVLDMCPSGQAL
jgi:hypothetical protein